MSLRSVRALLYHQSKNLTKGLASILLRGITLSYSGMIAAGVFGTLVQSLILRRLGPQVYGEYTLLLTSLLFIALVLGFGFDVWVLRDGGAHPDQLADSVWQVLLLKIAGLIIVLIGLSIGLIGNAHYTPAFLLGLAGTACSSFAQTAYAALRARQRNGLVAIFQIIEPLLLLGALFFSNLNPLTITMLMGIRFICSFVLLMALLKQLVVVCGSIHLHLNPLRALRGGLLYLTSDGLATIYLQAPTVALGMFIGASAVGIFRPALDLLGIVYTVPTLAFFVALPLLSNPAITHTDFIRLVRILVIGSFLFGIAMIGGIVFVGQRVLDSFTGAEYAETYSYLLLLSPLPLLKACNLVAAAIILSRDAVRTRVVAQGFAVISSIVLNYLLTPRLGIYGATYAVLATEIIILILYMSLALITYRRSTFGIPA